MTANCLQGLHTRTCGVSYTPPPPKLHKAYEIIVYLSPEQWNDRGFSLRTFSGNDIQEWLKMIRNTIFNQHDIENSDEELEPRSDAPWA